MSVERKLAAIMFTDIAGYTALSGKDENKALEVIQKQKEIVTPLLKKFKGTLHKETGDGLVLTFQTVTDAVKFSINLLGFIFLSKLDNKRSNSCKYTLLFEIK